MICVTSMYHPDGKPFTPSIWPCTVTGLHKISCPDRDINRAITEHVDGEVPEVSCRGCLPRPTDGGFLCRSCTERVIAALAAWPAFREKLDATGGRAVSAEGGGGSALGFANLSLVFLAVDECERHLASREGRTVEAWAETPEGAADAIMFSHAAERAWNALPVEPSEDRKPAPQRCHSCGFLPTWGNDTRQERGADIVVCRNCGTELARIRPDIDRWAGSATCEHQLHADCSNLTCTCQCHDLGARSRPGGAQALWDADQHTISPSTSGRTDWVIADALTITPTLKEKAA